MGVWNRTVNTRHCPNVGLILPNVYDAGPTLNQHWFKVCFLVDQENYVITCQGRVGQRKTGGESGDKGEKETAQQARGC